MAYASSPAFRLVLVAAVGVSSGVCLPLAASASTHSVATRAEAAAGAGVVYGGRSAQGWPVVIELTKSGQRVKQAVIGVTLRCASGGYVDYWDVWGGLAVNRKRRFAGRFGPEAERYEDGTASDFEGAIAGALNRGRTMMSGTWRLKITDYDSSGNPTDTCTSGPVRWSAKQ